MLQAVDTTARETLQRVTALQNLRQNTYEQVRAILRNAPSREISDLLLSFPYLKIQTLVRAGIAQRATASTYLKLLAEAGLLSPLKIGRDMYYVNQRLMNLFATAD